EPRTTVSPVLEPGGGASWAEYAADDRLNARSSRGGPPGSQRFVVYDGPGGRYETDTSGLWRTRGGRRVRLSAAFLPGATGSEDPAGRLWLGGEPGHLDVVWGDSLGSTCAACLPPSLRAALDTLKIGRA